MRKLSGLTVGAIGVGAVLATGFSVGPAAADGQVILGGGAGMMVGGNYCTLTAIGHDRAGDLVGFTAGHCGGPGTPVVAEGADSRGPVGTIAAAGDGLDYAVIKFDPAKVSPTANFAGFEIHGIGPDPDWHQPACTDGAANGVRCGGVGSMPGPGPRGALSRSAFQPGDDGGPITADDMLIGVAFGGLDTPGDLQGQAPSHFTEFTKFSAILSDVNAKGRHGAGFTPI